MDQEALRKFIKDYQLGLRDDIEVLESLFLDKWVFVDGDGFELTLFYGNGHYAIFYHHRTLKHIDINLLGADPLKDLIKFVHGLEERYVISFEEYTSRILGEFAVVEGRGK
jgi:hypothetical protein